MTRLEKKEIECRELSKGLTYNKVNGLYCVVEDEAYGRWQKAMDEKASIPCETLRDYRIRSGYTLSYVSIRTSIPIRTLQRYEAHECRIENMTLKYAIPLARVFGLGIEDLNDLIVNEESF